jgi:hypothetical protein
MTMKGEIKNAYTYLVGNPHEELLLGKNQEMEGYNYLG